MFARARAALNKATRRQFTASATPSQAIPLSSKLLVAAGLLGASTAFYYSTQEAAAFGYAEENVEPPHYPWVHDSIFRSYDHMAIRRGYQVYKTIGSACHSMKYRYYRQLVNVAYTEDEMRAIAAEYDDYLSEPDDEGEINEREGELTDPFWNPYANEAEARYANGGALPPDLSQIAKARHGGEDYLMALLTGYRDPPHGVVLGENMYYNLYFPGGQLAMPPPLADGAVEYEDGTEASISQQAKDVVTFLTWSAYMEMDERHLMGVKSLAAVVALSIPIWFWNKHKWSYIKHRNVAFARRNKD
jgi:ubiquinol-cytochrome c reductase cytochrome c1 subunit